MKYLRVLADESAHEAFKSGSEYVEPHICYLKNSGGIRLKAYTPPPALAGDVAYWDGSKVKTTPHSRWSPSLGTPIGVVVIPEGFAPDGKIRIVSLLNVDASGNTSTSSYTMKWNNGYVDTSLTNFDRVPTTDNNGSTSTGSNYEGYLPSDNFTGATSFVDPKAKYKDTSNLIPSPYLGDIPNPEYYKEILSGSTNINALSDFNGLSNTKTLVDLGVDYVAANACWKYNDGASNLQWYLPAIGELGYLASRLKEINNVIKALGGADASRGYLWSSSESSSRNAYRLNYFYCQVFYSWKSDTGDVRPFATIGEIKKPVKLITFTISDTEYQAEEGMTWEEWVNSQYNELGAVIKVEGGCIYVGYYYIMEKSTMLGVSTYDLIVEGENYLIGTHNGGDND